MADKKRILVVEDDRAFRLMLSLLLKRAGYDVETAEDGQDGLEKARAWHPNLILVDWMMPVMTGTEMCRELRRDPELNHAYVIMLSAKASTQDVVTGLDEGADDYLIKPTGNAELMARVRAGLRVQELQETLAAQYAAAAEERARLEAVLSSVADGIIVLDAKGRIKSLNQMATRLLGAPNGSLVGKHIDEIGEGSFRGLLNSAQSNGDKMAAGEVVLHNQRSYMVRCTPVTTEQSKGWVATLQDITHHKELDRLKSQALQHVAHDIRSPLTRVRGFVEAMEYLGPLNEAQIDAQKSALQGADLIHSLVTGLLDLERIEAGITERQKLDLSTIVYDVIEEYRWQASNQQIQLLVNASNSLPELVGDKLQLGQALRNLVDNAIKYTPAGGTVTVSLWQEGSEALISVADTGSGVPTEMLPHLFDRFYRVPGQSKTAGCGLGLSIVKSVVESHDGRVWAESRPGAGSTFYISLPTPSLAVQRAVETSRAFRRPPRHRLGRPTHVARTMGVTA